MTAKTGKHLVRFEDRGLCTFCNVVEATPKQYRVIADALSRKLGHVVDVKAVYQTGLPGHTVYTSSQGAVLRAAANDATLTRGAARMVEEVA